MKKINVKRAMHIVLFSVAFAAALIITKSTVKNIKQLYGSEKKSNTAMTCFSDLIY